MGIEYDMADVLIRLRSEGASFDRIVTLGRQNYIGTAKGTRALFKKYGLPCNWVPPNPYPHNFADGLFQALGAKDLQSLDIDSQEVPTLVHDLNQPVPETFCNRFDLVLDAGTLEHIFNISQALFNCMRMVRVGGKLVIDGPVNNCMGHGFFQFSPELFFTLFSAANGFRTDTVTVIEHSPRHRVFEAVSPDHAKRRFETTTFWKTTAICVATKVADVPLRWPQQSDYAGAFVQLAGHRPHEFHRTRWVERFIAENFPKLAISLKALKFSALRRSLRLGNRTAFKRK